jgi:hypothetical protein
VISIPKPRKDPEIFSPYHPISLLETIGKLFERILQARILSEVNCLGLLCDEHFGFRPKHLTFLRFGSSCLVERVDRSFNKKMITDTVFRNLAKALDTVRVNGGLYYLTAHYFSS